MKNKNDILKKIYTFIIVSFPILNIYASPLRSMSIADLALLIVDIFIIINIIKNKKIIKKDIITLLAIPCIWSIFQTLILLLNDYPTFHVIILPTLRLLIYFTNIALFGRKYIDISFATKTILILANIASIALIAQFILLKVAHIYIPGTIPFIPKMSSDLTNYELHMANDAMYSRRVRSVFVEPSHFAIYMALALIISLNKKEKSKWQIILYIISMLLSESSTAILITIVILLVQLIQNKKSFTRKQIGIILVAIPIIIASLFLYIQSDSFDNFYDRTFISARATTGRFSNYSEVNNEINTTVEFLFGKGVYKTDYYIPTIPRIYLYFGIIGIIYISIITILLFRNGDNQQKAILIALIALSFESELLFSNFMLPYFTFLIVANNKTNRHKIHE